MGRFLRDYFILIFGLFICEYCLYLKDYNECTIINEYVCYDIENGELDSIENEKYSVDIYVKDEIIAYDIIFNRDSIFNIKYFKTIKYHGIVD